MSEQNVESSEPVERGSLEQDTPGLDPQQESAEDAAEVFEGEEPGTNQ